MDRWTPQFWGTEVEILLRNLQLSNVLHPLSVKKLLTVTKQPAQRWIERSKWDDITHQHQHILQLEHSICQKKLLWVSRPCQKMQGGLHSRFQHSILWCCQADSMFTLYKFFYNCQTIISLTLRLMQLINQRFCWINF